jgi:hypothetical protein
MSLCLKRSRDRAQASWIVILIEAMAGLASAFRLRAAHVRARRAG